MLFNLRTPFHVLKLAFILLLSSTFLAGQSIGDLCTLTDSGAPGECKLIDNCPKAQDDLKNHNSPQNCGFQSGTPIVCCPKNQTSRKVGEISKKKCREYAEFVYEEIPSPLLIPNPKKIRRYQCGNKVIELILGEKSARKLEFPHMVALGSEQENGELKWFCGGTLLSELFVLTAAHCLSDPLQGNVTHVRMGVINLNSTTHTKQDFKIAQIIPHPEYHYPSHYHDIGLIKLEKPAVLNPYVRPACLQSQNQVDAAKPIATGWGDTTPEGDSPSSYLIKVTLPMVDANTCNETYKTHNLISRRFQSGILGDIQLCAPSDTDKAKDDTCKGDSGGPLQVYHDEKDASCMYDVLGVTSFGQPCSGAASVFVKVSYYLKWIEDIVWPNEE